MTLSVQLATGRICELNDSEDTVNERGSRLGLLVLAVLGAAFILSGFLPESARLHVPCVRRA